MNDPCPTNGDAGKGSRRSLGQFDLVRKRGDGVLGECWEAQDTLLGREVDLIILRREICRGPSKLQRVQQTVEKPARLLHANVVAILEMSQEQGEVYLVLEHVERGSLTDDVQRFGPLPWWEATRCLRDAAAGLALAHELEIFHRHITPSDLVRTRGGVTKLRHFFLSHASNQPVAVWQQRRSVEEWLFRAPEQWESNGSDARSNAYSLGCTYYYLLTGQPPFAGRSEAEIRAQHADAPAPDPRAVVPAVPAAVCAVLQRAMEKAPEDRYSSVAEMLADLERVLVLHAPQPKPLKESPVRRESILGPEGAAALGIMGMILAILLLFVVYLFVRPNRDPVPPPRPPIATIWLTVVPSDATVTTSHPSEVTITRNGGQCCLALAHPGRIERVSYTVSADGFETKTLYWHLERKTDHQFIQLARAKQ